MARTEPSVEVLTCGFCGQTQHEVQRVFASADASICDACVGLMMSIMAAHHRDRFEQLVDEARSFEPGEGDPFP